MKRAFIFANGDANDGPMVRKALAEGGEAPHIIAADGGARVARYYDFTPHTVLTDEDSLNEDDLAALAADGAEIIRHPPEKNETDLELTLLWAADNDFDWLRIFGGIGDRIDQTLANLYLLALPELRGRDVQLVAGKQTAWLCYPGTVEFGGAAGDTISLVPVGGMAQGIRSENLYYPLDDETLTFGPARGISNVMNGDRARLHLRAGLLLVIHTLGRA